MRVPCAFLAILAAIPMQAGATFPGRSVSDDVADVATRVCLEIAVGRLRWNPADLAAEAALFKTLRLKPGIPAGIINSFGRNTAATFNRSVLASRPSGASHVLLAAGGALPGCRVAVAGAPGAVTASAVTESLARQGWRHVPELDTLRPPIERRSFVRRAADGSPFLLDVLTPIDQGGTFRLMTTISRPPAHLRLPEDF